MNCSEIITALGQGIWYLPYDVALATVTRQLRGKYEAIEKTTVTYELRFRKADQSDWERREFITEEERGSFIERGFSEISLTPVANPNPNSCEHILLPIVGEQLSAITFVMDYVQIYFNEHRLNCYAWPTVWLSNRQYSYGKDGYRDALCELIAKQVTRFEEYLDVGLVFEFAEGMSIEIPILDPTGQLIETAEYHGPEGVWMVWR